MMPAVLLVFGALMVSNVRLPKFSMRWSKPVNAFQVVNLLLAYIFIPLRIFPEYLFFLSFTYLIVGTTWAALRGAEAMKEESSTVSP